MDGGPNHESKRRLGSRVISTSGAILGAARLRQLEALERRVAAREASLEARERAIAQRELLRPEEVEAAPEVDALPSGAEAARGGETTVDALVGMLNLVYALDHVRAAVDARITAARRAPGSVGLSA